MGLRDMVNGLVEKAKDNPVRAAGIAALGAIGVIAVGGPAAVAAGVVTVGAAAVALPGAIGGFIASHLFLTGAGVVASGIVIGSKKEDKKDDESKKE